MGTNKIAFTAQQCENKELMYAASVRATLCRVVTYRITSRRHDDI